MGSPFWSTAYFWQLVSIPFVASLVGWFTNWIAIKMTFQPIDFVGYPPYLGWQGIIPRKTRRMASVFVDSTMHRIGRLSDVFREMDPDKIARHVISYVDPRLDGYVDEVMQEHHASVWNGMPPLLRKPFYARIRKGLPELVQELLEDIGDRVEELTDIKELVTTTLLEDKRLLNRIFLESGDREFKFIVRSGAYFGFTFGLVQLGVWIVLSQWWVLPLFGFFVGYATNWLALNLIFRPLEPRKVGPFVIQGLYLRRQKEVAAVWCKIVTRNIVTLRQVVNNMLAGPKSDQTHALIKQRIRPIVDEAIGGAKLVARVALGKDGIEQIRDDVGDKAVSVSAAPFDDQAFNEDRATLVEKMMRERIEALPPREFQDLLRPCFQEEELTLILVGAALGLMAGFVQMLLM